MNLNLDMTSLKEQIRGMLGKRSESPSAAPKKPKKPSALNKITKPLMESLARYSFEHETMMGVDITPHYVRVCQMNQSYGQWMLNNLASSCIESQFRKFDIQGNPDLYVENLRDLVTKNNIKIKNAAFSLPTSSSIIKVLNFPDMSEEDFAQAAALGSIWESMVTLDGGIAEYSVYYKILSHNPPKPMAAMDVAPQANIEPLTYSSEPIAQEQELAPAIVETPAEQILDITPAETMPEMAAPQEMITETPVIEGEIIAQPTEDIVDTAVTEIIPEAQVLEDEIIAEPLAEAVIETTIPEVAFDTTPMPMEAPGPTMDVLFVASKLADIYLYSDIIRRAGLNPILADVRCLALKHAFESNPDNLKTISGPYAFLEFGPDENYIFIIDGHNTDIYNIFVSDDDKNVIIYHSEDMVQMGTFVENFALQAQQILNDHENRCGTGRINNIFVSSSAPMHVNDASSAPLIKTFVDNISASLGGYKVSECNFCSHIKVPELFARKVNAEGNLSAWAPTIGISARKIDVFGHEKGIAAIDRINLLFEGEVYKQKQRTSVLSTIAVAGVLILTLALIANSFLSTIISGNSLSTQISSMDKIEAAYNEKLAEAQKLTLVMNQVSSLDNIKNSLPSNQTSILAAYNHITNVIPEGVWLSDVTYTAPDKIEISGNSVNDESILQFVDALNSGNFFEKLVLKNMQTTEEAKDPKAIAKTEASLVKNFHLEGSVKKNTASAGLEILSGEAKKNGN
jgi:Tfp pilus assembly PilM family ATPase/Tfp pilus assembly protein PilN